MPENTWNIKFIFYKYLGEVGSLYEGYMEAEVGINFKQCIGEY